MERVYLRVYDLSQGMAKAMSKQLTGHQIDGIWHTGVQVWDTEYSFGQGVEEFRPGHSHYGQPIQIIDLGMTEIPQSVFQEFIGQCKAIWTAQKYHLLDNNCNNFSQQLVEFLVGKTIPSYISDLPAQFLSTPFGQMLRPTIEAMFSRPHLGGPAMSPDTTTEERLIKLKSRPSVNFTSSSDISKIHMKFKELASFDQIDLSIISKLDALFENVTKEIKEFDWGTVDYMIRTISISRIFPLLDVLRLWIARDIAYQYYDGPGFSTLHDLTDRILAICSNADIIHTHTMILRIV